MLFIRGEGMSSKHCPCLYRLKKNNKKMHTLTHTSWDKRVRVSVYCRLPERLRLLKDGDNKSSMSSRDIPLAIISVGPRQPAERWLPSLRASVSGSLTHQRCKLQATGGGSRDHTSRIVLASRRREPAATSSRSPPSCTAARSFSTVRHWLATDSPRRCSLPCCRDCTPVSSSPAPGGRAS